MLPDNPVPLLPDACGELCASSGTEALDSVAEEHAERVPAHYVTRVLVTTSRSQRMSQRYDTLFHKLADCSYAQDTPASRDTTACRLRGGLLPVAVRLGSVPARTKMRCSSIE